MVVEEVLGGLVVVDLVVGSDEVMEDMVAMVAMAVMGVILIMDILGIGAYGHGAMETVIPIN